jgi:hypothetical protein
MYKCSCGFQAEKGRVFSGHFTHNKGDEHKRLGWVDPVTGTLYPTRPRATKAAKTPAADPKAVPQGTVPVAALSSARPPVLFQLGQENIPLDFQDLYEAYQLYSDMRTKGIIKEASFTAILKDGIAFMWTVCAGQPGIVGDRVELTEVDYGGRPGNDKKEAGVKLATG